MKEVNSFALPEDLSGPVRGNHKIDFDPLESKPTQVCLDWRGLPQNTSLVPEDSREAGLTRHSPRPAQSLSTGGPWQLSQTLIVNVIRVLGF